ncbi:MAG: carboxylating nicotinate-nucleotide diphosphorylase [Planctomycetales bacterium]|nr:carboxylating nicotinate-nucleotide diphosphorylase [bacterium]UNM06905.1 MAG: carboxylating nicotinate-nucleotide diphosphorylase [Planctomycetales bacterium]
MNQLLVEEHVRAELIADIGNADISTELALSGRDVQASAEVRLREAGVVCGCFVAEEAFRQLSGESRCVVHVPEGSMQPAGTSLLTIEGPAQAILSAERVALNYLQRMSGIATLGRQWADIARPAGIRITGTRKTTPGFRMFEKYAIRCGTGFNHRMDLDHAVMLKDNHFAASPHGDWEELVRSVRARISHTMKLEAEADSLAMLEPLLRGGADIILLDNFSPDEVREAVAIIAGRAIVEVSGGVTLANLSDYLVVGVDVISTGTLSHSYRSLDIGLDFTSGGH